MKKTDCSICDTKEIALNSTIKIDGQVYCESCFNATFSHQKELEGKLIEKEVDTTICSSCNKDFGDTELNKISTHPVCSECETKIKNAILPNWVKAFFVGILIIVIGSIIWNWNYYAAYRNIKKSNEYFQKSDYSNAALLMKSASQKVPEVEDLTTLYNYYNGINLLSKDKCSEALILFEKCKDKTPKDFNIDMLIIQARIGSAFEKKDYDEFLKATKDNLALDSTSAMSLASVASAYACLYADKGDKDNKQSAEDYLYRAKQIDSTSKEMKDYYNVIDYRIDSRKIIKREDFIKQFPNGWIKN